MGADKDTSSPALPLSAVLSSASEERISSAVGLAQLLPKCRATPLAPAKARQLSDADWEDMKEMLLKLYIKENKTLKALQKVLREDHGLILSQKQLTKRFAEWNFKKNVKQAEIEAYLTKSSLPSNRSDISVDGVRITAAKRERWEKIAKTKLSTGAQELSPGSGAASLDGNGSPLDTTRGSSSSSPSTSSSNIISPLPRQDRSEMPPHPSISTLSSTDTCSLARHGASDDHSLPSPSRLSLIATNPNGSSSSLLAGAIVPVSSIESTQARQLSHQQSEKHCTWPFSSGIKDYNPALLVRLFSALKIDPPGDVTIFDLPPPHITETPAAIAETVSLKEIEDSSYNGEGLHWINTRQKPGHYGTRKRTAAGVLKFPYVDVLLPSQKVVLASPLEVELYPFPFSRSQAQRFEAKPASKYHDVLRKEIQECISRIDKLKASALGFDTAMLRLIFELAVAYFNLGHFDKAEQEFKRILPALEEKYGSDSDWVGFVKATLAEAIMISGRFVEANQMAQDVHTLALSIDIAGDSLVPRAIKVLAESYGYLRDLAKEEELLRQLVQIRLTSLGPRHGDTLSAIRSLCDSISYSRKYSESEELLRIALELSASTQGISDRRKCLICHHYAKVLYKLRKYPASEALYRKAAEMSERLLGAEYPDTLRCKFWLARVLRARGLLQESYDVLLKTVEAQIRTRTELRGSTIESMADLSALLAQMRRMEEAGIWMRRALRCSQKMGKIHSTRAAQFFEELILVDESPEQHERRSALYDEMAYRIISLV
ncbi:Nn.00g047990.m01.CDS01 [Neocucurbitaria sp. VM-36]